MGEEEEGFFYYLWKKLSIFILFYFKQFTFSGGRQLNCDVTFLIYASLADSLKQTEWTAKPTASSDSSFDSEVAVLQVLFPRWAWYQQNAKHNAHKSNEIIHIKGAPSFFHVTRAPWLHEIAWNLWSNGFQQRIVKETRDKKYDGDVDWTLISQDLRDYGDRCVLIFHLFSFIFNLLLIHFSWKGRLFDGHFWIFHILSMSMVLRVGNSICRFK